VSENLDLVRSIYAAWEHGDYGSFEWAHPEIEWDFAADGPTPELLTEAARLLKPGGRLYTKSSTPLPPQFRELAAGDKELVAELVGPLVSLKSRS